MVAKYDEKNEKLKDLAQKRLLEYMECKNSFDYFCSRYIFIEMPGEDVLLQPYEPQSRLVRTINELHYVLVLKSRQIGISTIIQAYSVWLSIFFDNVVIGIISKDGKEATDFARAIRSMIEKIPEWFNIKFDKKTEQSFILTNGSKVYASPVNPNAPEKTLRGKAITFLVIDEAAFIKFLDEAWTSMVSALSTNQMHARKKDVPYGTVILSTPNKTVGPGKWFYEKYQRAIGGDDIFKDFVIHWKDVSELADDPEWYNTQCQLFEHDSKKIQQELELKFLATSGSFFDEKTNQVLQDIQEPIIEKIKLFNGEAWRFSKPVEDVFYIAGIDTAPEHGDDKSAITVWDYVNLEQVFEYQGKCKVLDFVKVVKVVAAQYPGLLVIESNSYGNQVVEEMCNSEFRHMVYRETRSTKKINGLQTTGRSRPLMIDALYSLITEFPECVKSQRLVLELIGLISKPSGRVEADIGCHDDLALATALAFFVRKYDPPLMVGTTNKYEGLFKDIMSLNDDTPTGITNEAILTQVKKAQREGDDSAKGFINTLEFFGLDSR
jgi:hypothetical protein